MFDFIQTFDIVIKAFIQSLHFVFLSKRFSPHYLLSFYYKRLFKVSTVSSSFYSKCPLYLKISFYSKLLFEVSTLPSSFYSKLPLCLKGFHMLVARYTESLHCRLFICLSVLLFAQDILFSLIIKQYFDNYLSLSTQFIATNILLHTDWSFDDKGDQRSIKITLFDMLEVVASVQDIV